MREHIRALQAALKELGFDPGPVDGLDGPRTRAAALAFGQRGAVAAKPVPAAPVAAPRPLINPPSADDIPQGGHDRLKGVHADLVGLILEASARCEIPFTVIEGLRTAERQRQLVASGASRTQNSRHLTGHAVDLWPLDAATNRPLPSDAAFKAGSAQARAASNRLWADLRSIAAVVKQVAKERGVMIEWGGDWGWDAPHFQLNRKQYP